MLTFLINKNEYALKTIDSIPDTFRQYISNITDCETGIIPEKLLKSCILILTCCAIEKKDEFL